MKTGKAFEKTADERQKALLDELTETYEKGLAFRHGYRVKSSYDLVNTAQQDNSIPLSSDKEANLVQSKITGYLRNVNFLMNARCIRLTCEDRDDRSSVIELLKNLGPDES